MKVVIAIDSMKGSLDSLSAGQAAAAGLLRAMPEAEVAVFSVADGGEGTCKALMQGTNGSYRNISVCDPLGRKINAVYGISADGKTAVIEMASAAGLPLLTAEERDPRNTTTFGVGEMILDALNQGCRKFLIGLGGSATNDGGVGMLQALGFAFLDKAGQAIPTCGGGLAHLASIRCEGADRRLAECEFRVAVDVSNPLCGSTGCSAVFGPQKGADESTVLEMDGWLGTYARMTRDVFATADPEHPGAGAAGGMGFACATYLGATTEPGIKIVLDEIGIERAIEDCDIVITGEGRLDGQSIQGKTPVGVARLAKQYGKPVVAFSGCVTRDAALCNQHGIDAFFPILGEAMAVEQAMQADVTYQNLKRTVEQAFRLIAAIKNYGTEI